MPRFPYMNFPFPFYKTPSAPPPGLYGFPDAHINKNNYDNNKTSSNASANTNAYRNSAQNSEVNNENNRNFKPKNKSNINTSDYLFDLFGLKIYSDDVLLVSLIYFLYSEEVKDDSLFIVLILLLLS